MLYPTTENYDLSLIYAEDHEELIELKIGEDADIWEFGATDPATNAPWSDNYTGTLVGGTAGLPMASYLSDWEDTAGAFLVIDTSKFFNLNTYANGGRIGQIAGGSKSLSEYVISEEGVVELMDNYWWQVMSHPYTAKYRVPYDPTWRRLVRYETKLKQDIAAGKPQLMLDSSDYYKGHLFDEFMLVGGGAYDLGNTGTSNQLFSFGAIGCFVSDYDELSATNPMRWYYGAGSKDLGPNDTWGTAHYNTTDDHWSIFNVNAFTTRDNHEIWENVTATHNLPAMMALDGHIETATSNSYYEHDKVRLVWQNGNLKSWLGGGRPPCSYDINNVPIGKGLDTTQQGTTNAALIDS